MRTLYQRSIEPLQELVASMRADLTPQQCTSMALILNAAMEGLSIHMGSKGFHEQWPRATDALAIELLVNVVRAGADAGGKPTRRPRPASRRR
jgi:hypothetical protein